jgi:hypothetical protein
MAAVGIENLIEMGDGASENGGSALGACAACCVTAAAKPPHRRRAEIYRRRHARSGALDGIGSSRQARHGETGSALSA